MTLTGLSCNHHRLKLALWPSGQTLQESAARFLSLGSLGLLFSDCMHCDRRKSRVASGSDPSCSLSLHNARREAAVWRRRLSSGCPAPPSGLGAWPLPLYLRLQRGDAADSSLLCSDHR